MHASDGHFGLLGEGDPYGAGFGVGVGVVWRVVREWVCGWRALGTYQQLRIFALIGMLKLL